MDWKKVLIIVGIVVVIVLGLIMFSNVTGGVITGMTVGSEIVDVDYYELDEVNKEGGGDSALPEGLDSENREGS
jgi:hypothetical protein